MESAVGEAAVTIPSKIVLSESVAGSPPRTVTFRRPFLLSGLDVPHPPGTFTVRQTRTALDVSWPAFVIRLSLILVDGGITRALDISRRELEDALVLDAGLTH